MKRIINKMSKIQDIYKVVSNKKLSSKFYRLGIKAEDIVKKANPGQFVHIRINDGFEPFLRRPFSICRARNNHIEIFYEVVGKGTQSLAAKQKEEALDVLGPVGNSFAMPPRRTKQIVMIAGGIGVAPFVFLSDILKKKNYEMVLLCGGRTKDHIYPMKEFKENGVKVFVATDDGSVGVKGRVSELFSKVKTDPQGTFIYTCGPHPMMAAVQKFAREFGLKGQASSEETMACGLGACLGCSTRTTSGFKTACCDGPVFDLDELIF